MKSRLLSLLLFAVLLSANLTAQELPHDNRTISLRLFGADVEPIGHQSGEIRFLDPGKIVPEEERNGVRYNSYFSRTFHLPDGEFMFDSFPVDLEINHDWKRMTLRLDADIDSIRFREGSYNVPWRFEPLFAMMGLDGTRIPERSIACFEVFDHTRAPRWPSIPTGEIKRFRFDTVEGNAPSHASINSYPSIAKWDWTGEVLFMFDDLKAVDPMTSGVNPTLYCTRNGRHFLRRADQPLTRNLRHAINFFFADPERGWSILDTGDYSDSWPLTLRTTDGGESWLIDSLFSAHGIIDATPRDHHTAWFLGMHTIDGYSDQGKSVLRLYTGPIDGTRLTPIAWPDKFDSLITRRGRTTRYPELLEGGDDWVHYFSPSDTGDRSRRITPGRSEKITDIPGHASAFHTAPDGTGWMVVSDAYHPPPTARYRSWWYRFSPCRLVRISADHKSIRPLLFSGYPLHNVAFADATTGVVTGDTFILLTIDAGKSWRYIPNDTVWSRWGEMNGMWGPVLTPVWPNPDTLRMVYSHGYIDLPIDDLPPTRNCGGVQEEEYQGENIE